VDALHRLRSIDGIAVVHLDEGDIVRNALVQKIVRAYEDDRPSRKKE
jgi:phosphate starvation-inducible PhoH-like protein